VPGETLTRRTLLQTAGAGALAAALPSAALAAPDSQSWPHFSWTGSGTAADLPAPDPIVHLVNRITFGLLPADLERARSLGFAGFVEEQIHPESIDDSAAATAVAGMFPTLALGAAALLQREKPEVVRDLKGAALYRAVRSRRQLFEMMVDFWSNHFNVYHQDGQVAYLKTVDDREVVRPYAFGRFRDLLGASAKSPAMLLFLDNASNTKAGPNENYGRELMELHTLGVDGGYTQADVQEVARAFTGWTVGRGAQRGTFVYSAKDHDDGARTVLGQSLPAGLGQGHGERVLDILAGHPATARRIASKLCVRFVSDTPPGALVDTAAAAFSASGGDIRATLRTILLSAEFRAAVDQKLRRPFEAVAATLRTLDAQLGPEATKPLLNALRMMGQLPFDWPAPNGYPDANGAWGNTNGLLNRWNLGLTLGANRMVGVQTDLDALAGGLRQPTPATLVAALSARLLQRPLAAADRDRIVQHTAAGGPVNAPIPTAKVKATTAGTVSLLLDSPYLQWR
jgi:uncharacterized protein (DUF1800 family)